MRVPDKIDLPAAFTAGRYENAEPEDFAPALEQARKEFEAGKLDFDETFDQALADGWDEAEHEGDYDRRVVQADEARATGGWDAYRETLARLLPRTYEVAREAIIEARVEEIVAERGGRGW
ncbi:MAG: hypothetical protein ACOC7J_06465 [Armatimonadota bacterium]